MIHRPATKADLQKIKELLNSSKLPSDDCDAHIENFIVIEERDKIIAVGGLQICGATALLRSIAVEQKYRGKGIAKRIYKLIEDKAAVMGITSLYLLTESAIGYFEKLGFVARERSKIPESVMDTKQFKELCPSSATVMFCKISDKSSQ